MTDPDSTQTSVPTVATGPPPAPDCRADGCTTGGGVEPGQQPEVPIVDVYANWAPDGGGTVSGGITVTGPPPTTGCAIDGCVRPDLDSGSPTLITQGPVFGTLM
jgi:hypothetical protein